MPRLAPEPAPEATEAPGSPPRRRLVWAPSPSRWVARHALTLAAGLGAALPVIVSTIRALAAGWEPVGDRAIVATRAYDVLTAHSSLLGEYSDSTRVIGQATHNLGPLLFWLLALPARIGSPALALTMGLVNSAAILAIVALARRRGGRALMLLVAVAVALMCRSLVAELYHDIWNPSAPLLPFTLLIFLCWSLACGDHRLLPVSVLVASFAAQCHLAFLLPSVGLLAVGTLGLVASRGGLRRRAAAQPPPAGAAATSTVAAGPVRRWVLAALVVAVICWTPAVADQLIHTPGNLTLLARTATAHKATVGPSAGWHAVVRAVGVPPWWLRVPTGPYDRLGDVRSAPSALSAASAGLVLAALLGAAVLGLRRRRRDIAAAAVVSLVLCAALGAVAAATPSKAVLVDTLGYTMWWGSPVGMWVWLSLAWSAAGLLGWGRTLERARAWALARPERPRLARLPAPALGLVAVVAIAAAVAAAEAPDEHDPQYHPVSAIAARLDAALPRGWTVWLDGSPGLTTQLVKPAMTYALRRHDIHVVGLGGESRLGHWYALDHRRYDAVLYVHDSDEPPVKRGRIVARVRFRREAVHTITVSLARSRRR